MRGVHGVLAGSKGGWLPQSLSSPLVNSSNSSLPCLGGWPSSPLPLPPLPSSVPVSSSLLSLILIGFLNSSYLFSILV